MMSLPSSVTAAVRPRAVPALSAAMTAMTAIAGAIAAPPAHASVTATPSAHAAPPAHGTVTATPPAPAGRLAALPPRVRRHVSLLGLAAEASNGWTAIYGTAARVSIAQGLIDALGIGTVAEYAGPGETGTAILMIVGNDDAPAIFATAGITVRSVNNETDQNWSIYGDATNLIATLPPGTATDTPAVDSLYGNITPTLAAVLPLVLEANANVVSYGIGFAATAAPADRRGQARGLPGTDRWLDDRG
jgi:hypothetical protein